MRKYFIEMVISTCMSLAYLNKAIYDIPEYVILMLNKFQCCSFSAGEEKEKVY